MSKISELSDGGNIQDGDTLIAVRSGGNVKVTYDTDNLTFGTLSASGDLAVDTDALFVDVSSGNVGIGTDSPARTLHIADSVPGWRLEDTDVAGLLSEFNSTADGTWQFKVDQENAQANSALAFVVGSAEAARIDSGGNVGIGTSSPLGKLDVSQGASTGFVLGADVNLQSRTNSTVKVGRVSTPSYDTSNASFGVISGVSTSTENAVEIGNNTGSLSKSNVIKFYTASGQGIGLSSEAARIDDSGNVGIGTISPASPLHVSATNEIARFQGSDAQIIIGNSGVGVIDITSVGTGDALAFGTNGSERARIDSIGNLLVGTTTILGQGGLSILPLNSQGSAVCLFNRANTTNPSTALAFQNNDSTVGLIVYNSTSTSYNTSSDVRLKENITDAPAGTVDALQVRSFDWKADGSHQDYGFVAQELEPVASYAVTKGDTEDDMWSVDYSKLVPMLVKEIQDLKARIATLEAI